MNILAAIGMGNDPTQKSLNKLNRNFAELLQAKSYHHKQNEKLVERQNNIIKRLMSMTNKAYDDNPLVGGNEGVIKDIQTDENKMMALLLGGGLLAAALMGGAGVVKNVKGFFGNLKDKVLGFMGIENNNVEEQEETQETIDQAPPSGSPTTSARPVTQGSAVEQGQVATSGSGTAFEHYKYLTGTLGLSDYHARGLVANAVRESSLNPKARSGDDGGPGGLFQWKGVRQTATVAKLVNSGDWKGQYRYALTEDVGPKYQPIKFKSSQAAADWWMKYWERPAHPAKDSRKHTKILKSFKFQSGGSVGRKRTSSKHFKLGGFVMPEFRFAEGGAVPKAPTSPPVSSAVVAYALPIIMKHEALSSLTPGVNDSTFYGKPSVKSGTPWSKSSKPNTTIHAYPDKGNVPTIGWGSIYNDSMMKGSSKVKLGDKWSKKKADDKLKADSLELLRYLRKKHPFYEKMTLQQQAGFLSQHYNTGAYNTTDSSKYPKFKAAFRAGKVHEAAKAHPRSGGAAFASRIADEQKYMKAGPATYPINTPVKKRSGGVVNLQQGGSPSSNRLKDAHSAGYMSSMMKKKHIRPIIVVQETVRYLPTVPSAEKNVIPTGALRMSSPSLTAKQMYRHQKGAFT